MIREHRRDSDSPPSHVLLLQSSDLPPAEHWGYLSRFKALCTSPTPEADFGGHGVLQFTPEVNPRQPYAKGLILQHTFERWKLWKVGPDGRVSDRWRCGLEVGLSPGLLSFAVFLPPALPHAPTMTAASLQTPSNHGLEP